MDVFLWTSKNYFWKGFFKKSYLADLLVNFWSLELIILNDTSHSTRELFTWAFYFKDLESFKGLQHW